MASLFGQTPSRPLVLHSPSARVSVPVPASPLSAWVTSEVLAQDFHDSIAGLDAEEVPIDADDESAPTTSSSEPQAKLLARFLTFVADKQIANPSSELAQVLVSAYERFNELFLGSTNIHSFVQSFEVDARADILTAYFRAFAVAREALGADRVKPTHPSALISATQEGKAELYALFGGQGVNEVRHFAPFRLLLTHRPSSTSSNTCTTFTLLS